MIIRVIGHTLMLCSLGLATVSCRSKELDCSVNSYKSASRAEKSVALSRFLKGPSSECRESFFAALDTADESEISLFKSTFTLNDPCHNVLSLVDHITQDTSNDIARGTVIMNRVKELGAPTEDDKRELEILSRSTNGKVNARLASVMRRLELQTLNAAMKSNPDCIAESARKSSASQDLVSVMRVQLLLRFLAEIGRTGFGAILDLDPKTDEDKLLVTSSIPYFGKDIVYPTLTRYEKGLDFAGIVIMRFPDSEAVFGEVIAAAQHGRFSKDPTAEKTTITLEDALNRLDREWGHLLDRHYAGNVAFAEYAVKHLPRDVNVHLMSLIIAANARTAYDHFTYDPSLGHSTRRLEWLIFELFEESTRLTEDDRMRFFQRLFDLSAERYEEQPSGRETPSSLREILIRKLDHFQSSYRGAFIVSYFGKMNRPEREAALFVIRDLEPSVKIQALRMLRPQCTLDKDKRLLALVSK